MLKPLLLWSAVALLLHAADDPWKKVRELKSGAEIRVFKKGSAQPLLAKFADANDENLIVIVKNEQTAIARDLIDRLDARPEQKGSRLKSETKSTPHDPKPSISNPRGGSTPNSSYSSGVSIEGKPDFETVYRRPPAAPKK